MNNEQDLIKRIEALEAWKKKKEMQQISFPLDVQSIDVLNRYFVRVIDKFTYFGGAGGNPFTVYVATQDGQFFDMAASFVRYTADPTTDEITVVEKLSDNRFFDDEEVILFTTDTAPGGLTAEGIQTYHVVNADADGYVFQLSLTQGGSAVNITSAGLGRQLIVRL
jgi:hypothetical protein